MDKRKIKKLVKSNKVTGFISYIVKCVAFSNIIYYMKVASINFRSKFNINYKRNKKLYNLKNTSKSQSCIIIGNGPSVKFPDLNKIANSGIDSFGANRIVDIFDKTIWRPKYLCVMDPRFLIGTDNTTTPIEYFNCATKNKIDFLFFTSTLKKYLEDYENQIYFINSPMSPFFSTHIQPFSENIALYVSDMGSVTQFMIQIAVYMGYKQIYLYGIDNTYTKYLNNDGTFKINNSIENHIQGIKKNDLDKKTLILPKNKFEAYMIGGFTDKRKCDIGYEICAQYAARNKIEIINLTHGGNLDFFKRKEFSNIFDNY